MYFLNIYIHNSLGILVSTYMYTSLFMRREATEQEVSRMMRSRLKKESKSLIADRKQYAEQE